ncbi:phage antirepressor protein [Anaerofustis stercorihominis DSM 17244]|uniref:Phage antirepressor protein n=1 Tax=Anaerofustis stercorihominis DSM 17244 TaxID=445971 RepID=B1C7K4_9FIRM|nr:phage antirepressor KilAC domain-containing protein [Anaerofustis stercorihominis]EDS72991.1 phage antirepressor protein [Anaerofustis stercorihominis DSM 17244]
MNDLIKINYENDRPTVLGRDLHRMLEVNSNYTTWFRRMCEYGFTENADYLTCFPNLEREIHGGQNKQDHQLTIEMAKEICMLQRSEKGKQIRQYFIEVESQFNTPELVMARALKMADRQMKKLQNKLETDKPKVIFADAVTSSKQSILIGELAKLLKQNGIEIGQNRLFSWLRENGYLIRRKGSNYNMPTQRSMDKHLFEIKETAITHSDGHISISRTPKVTGRGQQYFINIFLS